MKIERRTFLQTASLAYLGIITPVYGNSKVQRSYRVGIIGNTGKGDYGHGLDKVWSKIQNCSVVGIADSQSSGLKPRLELYKSSKGYLSYAEMLKKEKVDIVCIAPRNISHHHEMAVAAIESGAKGIYMEKPFCRNLKEANNIVQLSEKYNCKISLAHRNRYHPSLKLLIDLINSKEIGEVIEIRARGKEDHRSGLQDLWILGSHIINIFPLITGKIISCEAMISKDNKGISRDDLFEGDEGIGTIGGNSVSAKFYTERHIPVYLDSTIRNKRSDSFFGMKIIGSKGAIYLDMDREPFMYIKYGDPYNPIANSNHWIKVSSKGIGTDEDMNLINVINDHITPVNDLIYSIEHNTQPMCNAYEGKQIIEALSAIMESHRLGNKRITLPLEMETNPLDAM